MKNEDRLRDKYLQFQNVQQQIEQITHHVEMMNHKNIELEVSIEAIRELEKTEKDNEVLAPIANGIFLKTSLMDNKTLIVNVGADVTVEKTSSEVIEILEQQKKDISENILEAEKVFNQLQEQAMKIYHEAQEE